VTAQPAESIQGSPEKGLRLRARPIVTSVPFHDLDRLGCAAIADIHSAGEEASRPGN
jgi:hypothetical protein